MKKCFQLEINSFFFGFETEGMKFFEYFRAFGRKFVHWKCFSSSYFSWKPIHVNASQSLFDLIIKIKWKQYITEQTKNWTEQKWWTNIQSKTIDNLSPWKHTKETISTKATNSKQHKLHMQFSIEFIIKIYTFHIQRKKKKKFEMEHTSKRFSLMFRMCVYARWSADFWNNSIALVSISLIVTKRRSLMTMLLRESFRVCVCVVICSQCRQCVGCQRMCDSIGVCSREKFNQANSVRAYKPMRTKMCA